MESVVQPVQLIWNKGIAGLCDRRIPDEFRQAGAYFPVPAYAGGLASSKLPDNLISDVSLDIQERDLIWVRVSWLRSFVKQILPSIRHRFVLVTGDSDSCVPSELIAEAKVLLECPNLVRWYAQNYDGTLAPEKIFPLPIGIDFHTLHDRAIWGESISSPFDQETALQTIRLSLPSIERRIPKVYVDFAWRQGRGLLSYRRFHPFKGTNFKETRYNLAKRLRKNSQIFFQPGPLPRGQMWRERGAYAFVLSPHGVGLDCHRTWESLALGHVVLVPSSSLDPLYEGLPVVPLNNWDEITAGNLEKWRQLGTQGSRINERLFSKWWIDKMKSAFV